MKQKFMLLLINYPFNHLVTPHIYLEIKLIHLGLPSSFPVHAGIGSL